MEVATSLIAASSPPPATSTPSSPGVVRELVPRAARVGRSTALMGFWGTNGVFRRYLRARSIKGSALAPGIPGLTQGSKGSAGTTGSRDQKALKGLLSSQIHTFCSAGLRPSLRLVLCSTPLRGASRKVSKGGVPPPWPRHTAHPPIGSELPHPSPFSPSATTIRLEIQAGEIRAGGSGRRFRREKFGREIFFQAPAGAFAAATPLPSPIPQRSWPRGACKMAIVGREVAKMVVGSVSKVASWCEWRGC